MSLRNALLASATPHSEEIGPFDASDHRKQQWTSVLALLSELPSALLKPCMLLMHDVAMRFSMDGNPQHLLNAHHWPSLDLPGELLGDWGQGNDQSRASTLFQFSALRFFEAMACQYRHQPCSVLPSADTGLEVAFHTLAQSALASLLPAGTAFPTRTRQANPACAFARDPLVLVALLTQREQSVEALESLLDEWEQLAQALDDVIGFADDLANGVASRATKLLPCSADESAVVEPAVALATLVLTGRLRPFFAEFGRGLDRARRLAHALEAPSLLRYCERLAAAERQIRRQLGLEPDTSSGTTICFSAKLAAAGIDWRRTAIERAEHFLLADPSFAGAWDRNRRPGKGSNLLVAKAFPVCLILDILVQHGFDVRSAIDQTLDELHVNHCRYYSHEHDLIVPDADDLALGLRLIRHSSEPERHRRAFERPLRWLREHQRSNGQLPVWFRHHDSSPPLAHGVVLYGSDCAAVEANVLNTLISLAEPDHADLILASAQHWCARWLSQGLAACEHYTPLYSLQTGLELVDRLESCALSDALQHGSTGRLPGLPLLTSVRSKLQRRIQAEAHAPNLSPKDSAMLLLASLKSNAVPLSPHWITTILKAQRPDGSWDGEPLYIVPTQRGLSTDWFRSALLTTAFVFHALKTHEQHIALG